MIDSYTCNKVVIRYEKGVLGMPGTLDPTGDVIQKSGRKQYLG
jgi:hypothetical protein